MSRKSRIAVTILTAALVALGLCAAPAAMATSSSKVLRFTVVKRAPHYDVVKGHHHRFAVKRGAHEVDLHGGRRYRVVRRTHRYVDLRAFSRDVTARPIITAPNGGEFALDAATTVTWSTSAAVSTGYFRVSLKNTDSGASTGLTAGKVSVRKGMTSYTVPWNVTQAFGTYTLWVHYYSHWGQAIGSDVSDSVLSITRTPTPTPTVPPTQRTVTVPTHATKAQIDSSVASAVSAGPGTWVVFPAETFAYAGTFTVPDNINIRGQGIWDQGQASGSGGTWLQCSAGMRWGSHSTIEGMLLGENTAGSTCQFRPVARGSSSFGADTQANGSHSVTFSFVRFKGGSDTGANLLDLGGNFNSFWTGTLKKIDMVDTTWNDCEFERPQSTNAVNGTSLGAVMNIWWDSRSGGAQVHDLAWNRCHFGVKNGYHAGTDGYGSGRTIIFQPAPAEHASDGPRPNTGGVGNGISGWNPNFNWALVDHTAYNISFTDCLMEYAHWMPMNPCDYARSYSVWQGNHTGLPGTLTTPLADAAKKAAGWGNPPQGNWSSIPDEMWLDNFDLTRCYLKGSYPVAHSIVYEIARNSASVDSYCGTGGVAGYAGSYGNTGSGTFSNANRPTNALFTTDWSGTATSYTASPYDP